MPWIAAALMTLTLAATPVELRPVEGPAREVLLEAIEAEQLVVRASADAPLERIPVNQVQRLRWIHPTEDTTSAGADASLNVQFIDGSTLPATSFVTTKNEATIGWPGSEPIVVGAESLRAVRMGKFPEAIERGWEEQLQRAVVTDIVSVLRKNGGIDSVAGILRDVQPEALKFEFEGDTIDVKRNKVVGISYYRPQAAQLPAPRGTLALRQGGQLRIDEVAMDGDRLRVKTVAQVRVSVPMTLVDHLDLASLSLTYLSELEPESSEWTPLIRIPAIQASLQRWYEPVRDVRPDGTPLALLVGGDEQPIARGLSLHSRTQLIYRLAGQYRRFACLAGIDPGSGLGKVQLTVLADDGVRFQQSIEAGADAVSLDIDLTGVNRLTLLVDYGDQSDVADHLILGDARLVK
jgi:hypothetical protein